MAHRDKDSLTEEEKRLWRQLAETAKPLKGKALLKDAEPAVYKKPEVKKDKIPKAPPLASDKSLAELNMGAYAGIDRKTAERFRKGDYPIDATLDLHGMTKAKAQNALEHFLEAHYAKDHRCLLVITGKGMKEPGVLRQALPEWLSNPSVRPMLLAFDVAKPQHGGKGAYYILLKRKRR